MVMSTCTLDFYRGLIIIYPYGTFIQNKTKKIIVKSKYITSIIQQKLLLIEDKIALGLIVLDEPKEIDLNQFAKLRDLHRITEADREKWWSSYKKLYAYRIIQSKFFHKPILLNYPLGPQITVLPKNITLKKIYVGMSGYHYPSMYPSTYQSNCKMLDFYTRKLNSVEINSTFYRNPSTSLVKNLSKFNLVYIIKVNQYITHLKKLSNVRHTWNQFYASLKNIHHKIFCFLFQFSSKFIFNNKTLSKFQKLALILNGSHQYAFEFRHIYWYNNETIINLFRKNGWTLVIANVNNMKHWADDLNNGFNPVLSKYKQTSDLIYIRMHGKKDQYIGSYHKDDYDDIEDFIKSRKESFYCIFFNNTDHGKDALNNAIRLYNQFHCINVRY